MLDERLQIHPDAFRYEGPVRPTFAPRKPIIPLTELR
jgi:hypothetical protein